MKTSKLDRLNNNNNLKISLFYPKKIDCISHGEIKNSQTLNYKSFKPIENGLFCSKIFGSIFNDKCSCGKLKLLDENYYFICNYCEVELNSSSFRRERMGHINLNSYFINSLFFKKRPSLLSIITGISIKNINKILFDNYYIIIYSNKLNFEVGKIISFKKYKKYKINYFNKFYAETGFKAIYKYLKFFSVSDEFSFLKKYFYKNKIVNNIEYKKNLLRYNLFKYLNRYNINPVNIILKKILVLPPDLRPIIKLSSDNIISSDLNELYKILINRNKRLKKLIKFNFPIDFINNEEKLVQDSIENLFENKNNYSDLKSISDNIKGKFGIFRQNLLGKRVDYSGRAVIVSGPFLKLNECCIPINMAVELFRPFIYNILIYKYGYNIKKCSYNVNNKTKIVLNTLISILKYNYVILNRAPTLHRLGIQAFKVILTNDKVIKLHPLVCSSFNADFDGDQMAVHAPLTTRVNIEFKMLLSSINNVLSSSNGECSILPTQDIILGIYYATKIIKNIYKKKYFFNNINEIYEVYKLNLINLNTNIFLRIFDGINYNVFETTMGRALIYNLLPNNIPYNIINRPIKKKTMSEILLYLYEKFGSLEVVKFSDSLMRLGFFFSTHSGISISIDDVDINQEKKYIINKSIDLSIHYNNEYLNGLLSYNSRYKKILNLWELSCNLISNISIQKLFYSFKKKDFLNNKNNSLYYIINSGARGSEMQIRQISGLRGLIFYKNFGLLETPVYNSLKEGLSPLEFFYFSHSSRKTLADTALKTSSSGYLTRKLVEVCNNVIVNKLNCGSNNGLILKNLVNNGEMLESFYDRVIGRVLSEDVYSKKYNKLVFYKNTLIKKDHIKIIKYFDLNFIKIRSPITCLLKQGICSYCYGFDLSKNSLVCVGEVVGIIAAQSIGEPGTQLTMRTFHTGGVFISKTFISNYYSNNNGYVLYSYSLKYVTNNLGFKIIISNNSKIKIINFYKDELEVFKIPYGSILYVSENSYLEIGDIICKWDPYYNLYISEYFGYVEFFNFIENINFIKRFNSNTGDFNYEILKSHKKPILKVFYENNKFLDFNLDFEYLLFFNNNDSIKPGDILFKYPINLVGVSDIIGGLPRVSDLFEARISSNCSKISFTNGFVKFKYLKKKTLLFIKSFDGNEIEYIIPNGKQILVKEGDYVNKGDILVSGNCNPHDILKIYGLNGLFDYLLSEIKYVYYSQGVKVNDKHIEIVIKQMLNNVLIKDSSNSFFLLGDSVDKYKVINYNKKISFYHKVIYNYILSGITKSSINSKYFLSSASFQETNSVLVKSSIINKKNIIKSLKDNIMLGNIIPAGTGYYSRIFKK